MTPAEAKRILSDWLKIHNPPVNDCVVLVISSENSIATYTYKYLINLTGTVR